MEKFMMFMNPQKMGKIQKKLKQDELKKEFKSDKIVKRFAQGDYTKIQILIMHYLGFINQLKSITDGKMGALLKVLFKNEGAENIRIQVGKLGEIAHATSSKYGLNAELELYTRDNLEIVFELFKEVGLEDVATKVESDLERIKKIKRHTANEQ